MAKVKSYRVNRERLRALRLAKGWTMSDLARVMKMEVSTTARWENGKHRMRATYLPIVAEALGADPSELILPDVDLDGIPRNEQDGADNLAG